MITAADDLRAKVMMKGCLGHVPVTFANLKSPGGHRVLVNGRKLKHWQTDWSAGTQRWQIVCNVDTSETREVELVLEPQHE